MPQWPVEIVATVVGILAAVAGYSLREYFNRLTPFFTITTIDGRLTKRSDKADVPKDVVQRLNPSFYIGSLEPQSSLGDIYDAWDRCDDLKQIWPSARADIDKALAAQNDEEFVRLFGALFDSKYFKDWLQKLLKNNKLSLKLPPDAAISPDVINAWIDDKDEEVWFDFPDKARPFGKRLRHPAIGAKCAPLISAVTHFHRPSLESLLSQYRGIFEQEHAFALSCEHELKRIDNENSRWAFHCFIANNSERPFLVETTGYVKIVDKKTGTKYRRDCYLALINDQLELRDTSTPLVVKAGEGTTFALITVGTQNQMELGSAVREVFDRGDGRCDVGIAVQKVGLIRRQRCWATERPFVHG